MKILKNTLLFLIVFFAISIVRAQLLNNEGSIFIEQGAKFILEGVGLNQSSGLIINNGELIVEGDFENTGTINSSATSSKIVFNGDSNSMFTVGNTQLYVLDNHKINAGINIEGDLEIMGNVNFEMARNSTININSSNLILMEGASIIGSAINKYVATNGGGYLVKKVVESGSFVFPVGNSNGMTELVSEYTGSSFVNAIVKVKVNPVAAGNLPSDVTDYITRNWEVIEANISDYQNQLESKYLAADIIGQEHLIKGASYYGGDWSYKDADRATNKVRGTIKSASTSFTGSNFYGKISPLVFLQGSYSTSGLMLTTLSDDGLIPLTSPYLDAPATVTAIPVGTVDWIKVELRNANSPSTSVANISGFLKTDGSIVDIYGTDLMSMKDAPASSYVAIYHRNHLPIRTNLPFDLTDPQFMDMTTLDNIYNDPVITTNESLKSLDGLIRGMWSGDVIGNNTISYNGGSNDRTPILVKVGFATPNNVTIPGYYIEDVNLNGIVSYNGGANDRTPILINVGFATPNKILSAHID